MSTSTDEPRELRDADAFDVPALHAWSSAHDMQREHRVQTALAPHYPNVSGMVALCDDPSVLGAGFSVMQRLHLVDAAAAGPADLDKGVGCVERRATGWSDRHRRARAETSNPVFQGFWYFVSHLDERFRRITGLA
ncbi:hypothetical protein BH24ACT10_BH24ACT10_13080 [soil metagenome]